MPTNLTQCQDCKDHFPNIGLERLLPVRLGWTGELGTSTLCVNCRRKAYNTYKEPYPPGVDVYVDPTTKIKVLPRITLTEATAQYCLLDGHLESLPYMHVNSLEAVNGDYKVKMFEEKLVLEKARWLYGGDIGIDNARDAFSWQKGGYIELPPVGAVRERRNRIRQMFLQRELFASSKLPAIKRYIESGHGNLREIVKTFAI
ncbi:hypothetical protein BG015_008960 [Linnemannia schmuckeri]|uniref:Uncharacterized protein n=1 Tax=Linnemannia schmuckeri TaxID=64567 RepID=A0A9P5RYQ4_9FUNG|nr:hypothetical protein BG015_008960 [Linnemannia schmuckeri]